MILFKDLRHFFLGNAREQHQRRNLYEHLTRLIFPFSINKADIANPLEFFSVRQTVINEFLQTFHFSLSLLGIIRIVSLQTLLMKVGVCIIK